MSRALIDLDFLFGELIAARRPPSFDALASGPEFRALATPTDHRDAYNQHADDLERMTATADGPVHQIAVPDGTRPIGRLEANAVRVVEAVKLGAAAMARAILAESVELADWQPVAYRRALAAVAP